MIIQIFRAGKKKIALKKALKLKRTDPHPDVSNTLGIIYRALSKRNLALKEYENAMTGLLIIFKNDPNWKNGKAKDQLLQLFESLGQENPLVLKGRRKLSSLIFS